MAGATQSSEQNPFHVLFAILDWGLGHATRTWPLIEAARAEGAKVTVASSGHAGAWLDQRMAHWTPEFAQRVDKPNLTMRYSRRWNQWTLAAQTPSFLNNIRAEEKWVASCIQSRGITHVISDNCYGVSGSALGIPSALMSHQLVLPVPFPFRHLAKRWVTQQAQKFDQVWVPDAPGSPLSGELSRPTSNMNAKFIGPLSRFQSNISNEEVPQSREDGKAPKPLENGEEWPELLGMVSGPEPHLSIMEEALIQRFSKDGRPAWICSGRTSSQISRPATNVRLIHNASDSTMAGAIRHAKAIVCRSGYSSLMDLCALGQTAILIPTPGQPEQEKLAQHWHQHHRWATSPQHRLSELSLDPPLQPIRPALQNTQHRELLKGFLLEQHESWAF